MTPPRILVLVDDLRWALGTLYGPLTAIDGVTVDGISGVLDGSTRLSRYDLIHFTYWQNYLERSQEAERSVLSIHHLVRERVDSVIDALTLYRPDALIVSDSHRLCMFGEVGLAPRLIPYGIDKGRHSHRTLRHDRFAVGWLGREWNTTEYKRFGAIREAAEAAGVDYVDGGHVIGEAPKYDTTDDFYAAIDAYIVASYIDAGPLPALESLSRGIPVLATPTGMMQDVIVPGENGLLHDGSVEGMVAAIKEARLTLHRHVSSTAVPTVTQWVEQHRRLYAEVLSGVTA